MTAPETRPPRVLDVRPIPPREKHPAVFHTFAALPPGEAFTLVNDHDPVPLRRQLEERWGATVGWAYQEEGPAVWRVSIRRRRSA